MPHDKPDLSFCDLICCTTTVDCIGNADALAGELLSESLAACIQIDGPIRSHYRWKGKVHCSEEYRLTMKTSRDTWPRLKARLAEVHPFEEPQVIATAIVDASDSYRDWVIEQTTVS